ncbi:hypothetical protein TNCV_4111731 [Trichonephila clavipes]|nr:hypothetical protein TNCV_4111731 [Trichonephila clavipes]
MGNRLNCATPVSGSAFRRIPSLYAALSREAELNSAFNCGHWSQGPELLTGVASVLRIMLPLKTDRMEDLMLVKHVEAQSGLVGVVWKLEVLGALPLKLEFKLRCSCYFEM